MLGDLFLRLDAIAEGAMMAPSPKLGDGDAAWARFEDDCSLFVLSYVAAMKGDGVLLRQGATIMALYLLFLVHVGETRPHCLAVDKKRGEPSLRLSTCGGEGVY